MKFNKISFMKSPQHTSTLINFGGDDGCSVRGISISSHYPIQRLYATMMRIPQCIKSSMRGIPSQFLNFALYFTRVEANCRFCRRRHRESARLPEIRRPSPVGTFPCWNAMIFRMDYQALLLQGHPPQLIRLLRPKPEPPTSWREGPKLGSETS